VFHFYKVLEESKKVVLSHQFQLAAQEWMRRPPLNGFKNVEEILTFLNKRSNDTCLGEVRRQNAIIKEMLSIHQEGLVSESIETFFLTAFELALKKIFHAYLGVDYPTGDDLGQIIFSSFLDSVKSHPVSERTEKVASKIVSVTRKKVSRWVSKQKQRAQVEVYDEELLPKQELSLGHEDAVVTLIDLFHGFGHNEVTDRLCLKINQLHEKGIISDTEKRILVGRLVYGESFKDMLPKTEYQRLKKKIQRIIPKIISDTTD